MVKEIINRYHIVSRWVKSNFW